MQTLAIHQAIFQNYLRDFKAYLTYLGYSPSSVYSLPGHLREYFYYLEKEGISQLDQISQSTQEAFLVYLQNRKHHHQQTALSAAYLNKYAQALKLFSKYLNQSAGLQLSLALPYQKSISTEKTILSPQEIQKLYTVCDLSKPLGMRHQAMLSVYYACGLRRNEGVHLDVQDILFESGFCMCARAKTTANAMCRSRLRL